MASSSLLSLGRKSKPEPRDLPCFSERTSKDPAAIHQKAVPHRRPVLRIPYHHKSQGIRHIPPQGHPPEFPNWPPTAKKKTPVSACYTNGGLLMLSTNTLLILWRHNVRGFHLCGKPSLRHSPHLPCMTFCRRFPQALRPLHKLAWVYHKPPNPKHPPHTTSTSSFSTSRSLSL